MPASLAAPSIEAYDDTRISVLYGDTFDPAVPWIINWAWLDGDDNMVGGGSFAGMLSERVWVPADAAQLTSICRAPVLTDSSVASSAISLKQGKLKLGL
jgi:hypothetical protein